MGRKTNMEFRREVLKKLRAKSGMTQDQVHDALVASGHRFTRTAYCMVEQGQIRCPRGDILVGLAKLFNVPVERFFKTGG